MKLKAKTIGLDAAGKTIIILNEKDANFLGVLPLNRVVVRNDGRKLTAIVNTTKKFVKSGNAVVYEELKEKLNIKNGDFIYVTPREALDSKAFIREKIDGGRLDYKKSLSIINDIIERDLNDLEIAALITALHIRGMTIKETAAITKSMVATSNQIKFHGKVIDKHSIGGIPGDKTTIFVVPIISSLGFTIPKTSSRAITDPAGTADRMEIFCDVEFNFKQIKNIVNKIGACIVWGGGVDLSPADDLFIQVEQPLNMDPVLMPSILSKKKVVGSKYVVIDIPTGKFGKMKSNKQAILLGENFKKVGKDLGMKITYEITEANQPLGYAMGAALEAREILQIFGNVNKASPDLIKKLKTVSDKMMKLTGTKKDPIKILRSGKAYEKFKEIVEAQNGNPDIKTEDIELGGFQKKIYSPKSGFIKELNSNILKKIAIYAGCPSMKKSGVLLNKKTKQKIDKGELLYTIYSESSSKLKDAVNFSRKNSGVVV